MRKAFYLGIDQHANQLTISLRNEDGDVVIRKQVSTKPHKVTEFFETITRMCLQYGCVTRTKTEKPNQTSHNQMRYRCALNSLETLFA